MGHTGPLMGSLYLLFDLIQREIYDTPETELLEVKQNALWGLGRYWSLQRLLQTQIHFMFGGAINAE